MDNTSIITQVANPKDEESISSSQDKGKTHINVTHTHTHRDVIREFGTPDVFDDFV